KHFYNSGRIRLLMETLEPGKSSEDTNYKIFLYRKAFAMSEENIFAGEFEQGMNTFKIVSKDFAEFNHEREKRLIPRIKNAACAEDTAAVVGHFGSTHTGLGHVFHREGYQ